MLTCWSWWPAQAACILIEP